MRIAVQAPGCQLGPGMRLCYLVRVWKPIDMRVAVTCGKLDVRGNIVRSWQKLQTVLSGLAGSLKWLRGMCVSNSQTTQIAGAEHWGHSGK